MNPTTASTAQAWRGGKQRWNAVGYTITGDSSKYGAAGVVRKRFAAQGNRTRVARYESDAVTTRLNHLGGLGLTLSCCGCLRTQDKIGEYLSIRSQPWFNDLNFDAIASGSHTPSIFPRADRSNYKEVTPESMAL